MNRFLFIFFLSCAGLLAQTPGGAPAPSLDLSKSNLTEEEKADIQILITAAQEEHAALAKIEADNSDLQKQLAIEKAAHVVADNETTAKQGEVDVVTADRNEQAKEKDAATAQAAYWQQKDSEAVSKLWWWRIYAGGAIAVGVCLIAIGFLTRFTAWGAKTFGPLLVKAAAVV